MKIQFIFFITIHLIFQSCASSGMDRGKLPDISGQKIVIDDEEIKKYASLKPQLKMPFRVGVYFVSNEGAHYRINGEDKSEFLKIENELKEIGIVSQMFFVSNSILEVDNSNEDSYYGDRYKERTKTLESVKAIRILSSRYGADAVLIVQPKSYYKKVSNIFSIFYLTIAGIWIAPGSSRESRFEFAATLWDVKNEYLYFTSEADSSSETSPKPLGFIDDEEIVEIDKKKALDTLSKEVKSRFKSFK